MAFVGRQPCKQILGIFGRHFMIITFTVFIVRWWCFNSCALGWWLFIFCFISFPTS